MCPLNSGLLIIYMKNKIILKSHLYITKNYFTDKVKKSLTFKRPRNYYNNNDNEKSDNIILYRFINKKYIRVPRYSLGNLSNLKNLVKDNKLYPIEINFLNKIELNEEQKITIDRSLNYILQELGAVIVAEPGEGKTVMAIKILSELKVKTIILLHKDYLINQWKKAILELTDLNEEDIGLIKNGKFKDGKIVLGSIQSLMRKTIPTEINNLFSFKIIDETHRIGAEMFLKSFTRFNTRYSLALSATPYRPDKMEKVYFLHTSYNIVTHNSVRNIPASYKAIPYISDRSWKTYPSYIPYRNQVIRNIISDNKRNNLIMKLSLFSVKKLNRKVLLISEQIDILDLYYNLLLKEFEETEYKVARLYGFYGSHSELQKADIILASYKKASEGIDIPQLDTLIMLTPIASKISLKQTIGRIQRSFENKKKPLVIDIIDLNINFAIELWNSRLSKYEQWNITEYEGNEYDTLLESYLQK